MLLIFILSHHRQKYFNTELFPNHGIYQNTGYAIVHHRYKQCKNLNKASIGINDWLCYPFYYSEP